jgi:predicted 3-demethylubiquinone-9 3-methyltransferase (glyoxalase superfamily)
MPRITTCLWFDTHAEEAARFYVDVFPNSRITQISRYPEGSGPGAPGDVLTVEFELDGRPFTGLNGGPAHASFSEAMSLQVPCADQAENDRYWEALGAGGEHGPCGWLKDRYGLSWQVFPTRMTELIASDDREVATRATQAMMEMSRIDLAAIEAAVL